MTVSASFKFEIADDQETFWYDELDQAVLPRRMKTGLAGSWFHFLQSTMAQTLEQMGRDILFLRSVKYDGSHSSGLTLVGSELGFPKYSNDTDQTYKERVTNLWVSGSTVGTEQRMLDEFAAANIPSASFVFNLVGSDTEYPAVKGGSDYNIPPYPASTAWPSQFAVLIKHTDGLATKAGGGILSNITSDAKLTDIRTIIQKYKPVDWVCREILITSGSDPYYNDGVTDWDDGTTWSSAGTTILEKHKATF